MSSAFFFFVLPVFKSFELGEPVYLKHGSLLSFVSLDSARILYNFGYVKTIINRGRMGRNDCKKDGWIEKRKAT